MLVRPALLKSLEETGKELTGIRGQPSPVRGAASGDRGRLQRLSRQASDLKQEISARVLENMAFTREALGFFDDLFSMIIAGAEGTGSYRPGMKRTGGEQVNVFLHKEV